MSEKHVPTLETRKLGISFGGLKAVSDFNITIDKGELVGLIGPNGAGKTTVFNLLTGVYKPTEGTVLLDGVPLNGKKTHQFVAAGIARTFQNIRLFKDMTVIENVKSAFTKDIGYGMLDAALRTPKFWRLERESHCRRTSSNLSHRKIPLKKYFRADFRLWHYMRTHNDSRVFLAHL